MWPGSGIDPARKTFVSSDDLAVRVGCSHAGDNVAHSEGISNMKLKTLLSGAAVLALAAPMPAFAQENADYEDAANQTTDRPLVLPGAVSPIIVSASRMPAIAAEDYTGSVTIITPRQMEQRQVRDIADVLRDVPGVAVSSVAGQTQIRLRGSEANQVLVLVDGIEVSDPFGGEFDIGTLQAEPGSRVEVLRGPQSALYGSDAIGGVVAYESSARAGFDARIEGGSNATVNGAVRYGYVGEGVSASLGLAIPLG